MTRDLQTLHGHEAWEGLLVPFVQMTLPPDQARQVYEHVAACEICAARYAELAEAWAREGKRYLYVGERPLWGSVIWEPDEEREWVQEITNMALTLGRTGGLLMLTYDPWQELAIYRLLQRLRRQRRHQGEEVPFLTPTSGSPGEIWDLAQRKQNTGRYIIIHRAPDFPSFAETLSALLSSRNGTGPIVVASGLSEAWGDVGQDIPHTPYVFTLKAAEQEKAQQALAREMEEDRAALQQEGLRRTLLPVALLDAVGVPTPLSLLARLLDRSEADIRLLVAEEGKGYLFWILDAERNPLPLLCTVGEPIAQKLVQEAYPEEAARLEAYGAVVECASPAHATTVLRLIHGLVHRGRRHETLVLLERHQTSIAACVSEGSARERLAWATLHTTVGLRNSAERLFRDSMAQDPNNVYLHHAFARFLIDAGKYAEAAALLEQARHIAPDNLYLHHTQAECKRRQGHFEGKDGAAAAYEAILQAHPSHIPTLVAYATLRRDENQYPSAEGLLGRALEVAPSSIYAWHLRGVVQTEQGRLEEARESFEMALAIDPKNCTTLQTLGSIARRRGHLWKSETHLHQAEQIDPEHPYLLLELGELAAAQGDHKKARAWFEQVLRFDPVNVQAHVAYASLLGKQQEYAQAIKFLEKARDLVKEHQWGYPHIDTVWGEIEARQNNMRAANRYFEQAAWEKTSGRRRPHAPTLTNWAKVVAQKGLYVRAKNLLDEALQSPQNRFTQVRLYNTWAEVALAHAEQAYRDGRLKRAQDLLKEARKKVQSAVDADSDNVYTLLLEASIAAFTATPEGEECPYRVVLEEDQETGQFVAQIPTLGIADSASTLREAISRLQEMLGVYLQSLHGKGKPPRDTHDEDGLFLRMRATFPPAASEAQLMATTIDPQVLATTGEALYATRIKALVEPAHSGEYVAIEVDSGDYFLGRTLVEAAERARAAYPDKVFYFIKIGSPVVRRRGRRSC